MKIKYLFYHDVAALFIKSDYKINEESFFYYGIAYIIFLYDEELGLIFT